MYFQRKKREVHNFHILIHHQYSTSYGYISIMKCPQQESKLWNERWYATAWSHRVLWHHIQSTSHHQHHHCWCYTLNEYFVCLEFNFETPLSTQNAKPPCLFFKSIHYTHLHISNNWPLSINPRYFGGFIGLFRIIMIFT